MGDAIREQSDEDQDLREEFLVEYQKETPLEIQDIQLEAGMPQDTENKNLGKPTQDAQIFLVTPTQGMEYIHGTATKITFCIYHAQYTHLSLTVEHTAQYCPEIIWIITSQIGRNSSCQPSKRAPNVHQGR
ncbi:hypothetical protein O181_066000 [Austropuccinia psidii MF-1]|uniref:Uncharacterized protein n=1 Tax=Austropuccinia psidii MF-1 TaxID=1389203 RepID=A0A9Q3I4N6_9BASI|nr:hypothetical protein [Austropuccinia psidii MF-1]